jgi:hypothetical protein
MKTEIAVMERFVSIIQSDEPLPNPLHNRLQVYRDMVHFRFVETLENIYPILTTRFGPELMHELIREFIAKGAKSSFIVKMSKEFSDFLQHHPKTKGYLFLEDLLWLEYGEMDLLTQDYDHLQASLEWDKQYRLSSSSLVRSLSYRVHTGEFDVECVSSLMLYYHFDEQRVYFEEITPFAQQLIMKLKSETLEQALRSLADIYDLDSDVLRESVEKLLQKWCARRILTYSLEV